MRFVDGEGVGSDFVDLEPGVRVWHAFEGFVFGAGKEFAPVGGLGLLGFHRTCHGDTEGPEKSQAREIFEQRHFRSSCRWDPGLQATPKDTAIESFWEIRTAFG